MAHRLRRVVENRFDSCRCSYFINLLLTNNAVVKGATWGESPRGSIGLQVSTTQECEYVCIDNLGIKRVHALIKLVNAFFMSWEGNLPLKSITTTYTPLPLTTWLTRDKVASNAGIKAEVFFRLFFFY